VTDTIESAVVDRRAFAVRFSHLERWSVGSFTSLEWTWPASKVRPLGTVLRRKILPVADASGEQLITIRFSGEIEPREGLDASAINGRLFWAEPGDLVYSKIDVRHGSIGVIPETIGRACVTSEYPVYEVRAELADPAYVALAVRSRVFRSKVNSLISGASGRKRVQPDELEQVTIPVPPVPAQRAVVAAWNDAQAKAEAIRQRASDAEKQSETEFIKALGLTRPKWTGRPKAFAVQWSDLGRWGVEYNQLINSTADLSIGSYPVAYLGDCAVFVQYGSSQKPNSKGNGVPILRMNNILGGEVVADDLKYVELTKSEYDSLRLLDGDILINRTNSKELVGKCAPFHLDGEFVFASYLIRFRLDTKRADADYVSYVLNSFIGRQQIDALSRPIGGQANINGEELRSVQLPIPPLTVQSALMSEVNARRELAKALRVEADEYVASAHSAVEAMILGTKPVPAT
jgi:type I restriction enzyme S subunit